MQDVIEEIREKLDRLDREREELRDELEVKRYQLQKVEDMIRELETLQQADADT